MDEKAETVPKLDLPVVEDVPVETITTEVMEDIPEQPIIEELPEEVIVQETPDEEGKTVKKVIKKRVINKKQGDKEQNIEIVTVEEEGKEPETEITIEDVKQDEETPEKPRKKKVVKKVKKDDQDDYIQRLINMEIPKTELETFEKPIFDATPKIKSNVEQEKPLENVPEQPIEEKPEKVKKTKKPKKPEVIEEPVIAEVPAEQPEKPIIEELPVEIIQQEVVNEEGETVQQIVKKKVIKKKQGPREEVIEVQTTHEEGKEPETVVTVEQIEPEEEATPDEIKKPKKKKTVKKVPKSDEDDYIRQLMEADIPKTELESFEKPEFELTQKPKKEKTPEEKKKKKKIEETLPQEEVVPEKKIVIEPEIVTQVEEPNEHGEPVKKTVKKQVITKKEGPKEERIEIATVEEEGKEPITEVTVEEIPVEEPTIGEEETTPKKKKKSVKKLKPDEKDDYIQSLIDMEIPKTVLEEYEKPEFESKPKSEEERPQVEEQPLEIIQNQVINDEGETVKQVIKKKTLKKRQGSQEEIIQITTVEEEGKEPEILITVEDVQPEESDVPEVADESTSEEKPKPKKKRIIKKVKADEQDDYIRQVNSIITNYYFSKKIKSPM